MDRLDVDYEIHGLPGVEDIVAFEEYWLTNRPGAAMLFPAIVDATPETECELPAMITHALEAYAEDHRPASYYVSCVATDGLLRGCRLCATPFAVVNRPALTIETLEDFQRTGILT